MQKQLTIYNQRADSYPISIYKIPEVPALALGMQSE
jgi:hypothetical protein